MCRTCMLGRKAYNTRNKKLFETQHFMMNPAESASHFYGLEAEAETPGGNRI